MIYLGLGSNIGDKIGFINAAVREISKMSNTKVLKSSSIYKTEPWGVTNQDYFLNSVLEIETNFTPSELLSEIKKIESLLGRKKRQKWFEREIDIDILFFNNLVFKSGNIEIPHPEIPKRNFVLVPLCELNPGLIHPVLNCTVKELLENSKDNSGVIKFCKAG